MPALILNGTCGGCKACLKTTVSPQLTTEYVHLTLSLSLSLSIAGGESWGVSNPNPPRVCAHLRSTGVFLFLSSAWLGAVSFSLSLSPSLALPGGEDQGASCPSSLSLSRSLSPGHTLLFQGGQTPPPPPPPIAPLDFMGLSGGVKR